MAQVVGPRYTSGPAGSLHASAKGSFLSVWSCLTSVAAAARCEGEGDGPCWHVHSPERSLHARCKEASFAIMRCMESIVSLTCPSGVGCHR